MVMVDGNCRWPLSLLTMIAVDDSYGINHKRVNVCLPFAIKRLKGK